MIIVSQDKELVLNFKNIDVIGIGNPLEDDDGMFKVLASTTSDNEYTLGKYETEERAKEVLQEIVEVYANGKKANEGNTFFGGFQWVPADTLYGMPKE